MSSLAKAAYERLRLAGLNDCGEDHDEIRWEAFLAGFEASGEGFNGEYVGERYRASPWASMDLTANEAFYERMREAFVEWMARCEA